MLATVFTDDPEKRVQVSSVRTIETVDVRDVDPSLPLVAVPINADGDTSDMQMVCDLDDDYHIVTTHLPSSGMHPIEVYTTDEDVIFIRLGTTVIAVHSGPGGKEARESYRRATGGE